MVVRNHAFGTYAISTEHGRVLVCRDEDYNLVPSEDTLSWFQNRVVGRRSLNGRPDFMDPRERLCLPHHYAVECARRPPRCQKTVDVKAGTLHKPATRGTTNTLPDEILLQILAMLIPANRIFHFSPVGIQPGEALGVSVHQICKAKGCESTLSTSPLPIIQTCRRFRDIAYSLLYGESSFVWEVATTALTTWVDFPTVASWVEPPELTSWNRVYIPTIAQSGPTCPLSINTLRHVKDLTICVTVSRGEIPSHEKTQLAEYMTLLARSFASKRLHNLKRLTISAMVASRSHGSGSVSKILQFADGTPPRLKLNDHVFYREPTFKPGSLSRFGIEDLIRPLELISGDIEMAVGGLLDAGFGERLRLSMFQNATS